MWSSRRHSPSSAFVYSSSAAGSKGNAGAPQALPKATGSYLAMHLVDGLEKNPPSNLPKVVPKKAPPPFPPLPEVVPKKAPPPFPPSVIKFHRGPSRSTGEDASPAPTRVPGPMPREDAFINLHVHRANGDFIVEEMVALDGWIEGFLNRLDVTGLVPVPPLEPIHPSEEIDDQLNDSLFVEWSGKTWEMRTDAYVDELVWNGKILYWNSTFGFYVDKCGMSVSEPVYVTLVRTSARTLYAASKERRKSS